jgi:hypothetical protein
MPINIDGREAQNQELNKPAAIGNIIAVLRK